MLIVKLFLRYVSAFAIDKFDKLIILLL